MTIKLLGDFTMEYKGTTLVEADLSVQLCNLVAYLLMRRGGMVETSAIIDALWPEATTNPNSALKNLVYRFRKACDVAGFAGSNLIVSAHGTYTINPELKIEIDCDQLEELAKDESENRVASLEQAVKLYRGNFCPNLAYKEWAAPYIHHYSTLYFNSVYELLEHYHQIGDYRKMLELSKNATSINIWEEKAHKYFMIALAQTGATQTAIQHYHHIQDMFYRELGLQISDETMQVYNEIAKSIMTDNVTMDELMGAVQENSENLTTSYYCEYEVFKQICRYELRTAQRDNISHFVALLTITNEHGDKPDKLINNRAMDHLSETIATSLRKNDVYSRCTSHQFVILLHSIRPDDAKMVMNRIERNYKDLYHSGKVALTTSLRPLSNKD